MELYLIFLAIFGATSLIGVPVLSYVQIIFIHGQTVKEWLHGLPTTFAVIVFLMALISIIMYFVLRPLIELLRKSKAQALSPFEISQFNRTFSKMALITTIILSISYLVGNGFLVLLKAKKGLFNLGSSPSERIVTLFMVFSLCGVYMAMARGYCTYFYDAAIQKYLKTLHITDLGKERTTHFTVSLGLVSVSTALFVSVHMLCCGYYAARYGCTLIDFLKKVLALVVYTAFFVSPLTAYILGNFRKRFYASKNAIEEMRLNGDLANRLDIVAYDDFGRTNEELNKLIDSLNQTISAIKFQAKSLEDNAFTLLKTSENSAAGVNQIAATFASIDQKNDTRDQLLNTTQSNIVKLNNDARRIAELVTSQTAATESNASAITQMVANINSISEMVRKARLVSEKLSELSVNGTKEVNGTLDIITDISNKSKQMIDVITVIQHVAQRTNLLAMNAAIEAAHAGIAGKGFAVVAQEIRNLAESTSKSANNISGMIDEFVASINNSAGHIQSTSKAFQEIDESISSQLQLVETIARATEEQGVGANETLNATNEISSQIVEINSLMKRQADYSAEIESYIEEVVGLSTEVNAAMKESTEVVNDFSKSIEMNKSNAIQNQDAITRVNAELNKFKLV
ncbi:MAG: methyl-accepting chemotaxis protein [Treponema sp.]|nr:methyl-accepting chemotaxis protein [Treponema sp.]